MDPARAMENAKSRVSHSSLDGAKSSAAHRSHRPDDEVEKEPQINHRRWGIFK
jgi:hypothetical protein